MSSSTAGLKPSVRELLEGLGAIRSDRLEVFATRTRDRDYVTVYRDNASGVVFVDGFYVGEAEYVAGDYQPEEYSLGLDFDDHVDTVRRVTDYNRFFAARRLCDFGCGSGRFLRMAAPFARSVSGVEIHEAFQSALSQTGIACYPSIAEVPGELDVITLFHCLEHLPEPLAILRELRSRLAADGSGRVVVEVPHARDILLDQLACEPFARFTLWSHHLVLHTRDSLRLLLTAAGFRNIVIEGVQRFSVANHLQWLRHGRPGGHKSPLATLETPDLRAAYALALTKIDATDTLVAVATA